MTIRCIHTSIREHLFAVYMAKLYWRVKIDGRWTWRAANVLEEKIDHDIVHVCTRMEEEE